MITWYNAAVPPRNTLFIYIDQNEYFKIFQSIQIKNELSFQMSLYYIIKVYYYGIIMVKKNK